MSELVNLVSDETEDTPELVTLKARATTYGASISIGAYLANEETRVSANLFAKNEAAAEAAAADPAITSARINASTALFIKFSKKTSSNIYVGKPAA